MKMKTTMSLVTTMGSIALTVGSANAAIIIVNHSFESTDITANLSSNPSSTTMPGWTTIAGNEWLADRGVGGALGTNTDPTPDADGEQFLMTKGGGAYQVTSEAMAANTVYTLTVDIGDRNNQGFPTVDMRIGTGSTFGANLLAATVVSNTTPTNAGTTTDGWETWVYTFTNGAGVPTENLRVELFNTGSGQALFDNVRLDATSVPEPTTTALIGLGGLALILRRRK